MAGKLATYHRKRDFKHTPHAKVEVPTARAKAGRKEAAPDAQLLTGARKAVLPLKLKSQAKPGKPPSELVGELHSGGPLSGEEYTQLGRIYLLRNEIVHGFAAPNVEAGDVRFLVDTGRRLLEESQPAKQSA